MRKASLSLVQPAGLLGRKPWKLKRFINLKQRSAWYLATYRKYLLSPMALSKNPDRLQSSAPAYTKAFPLDWHALNTMNLLFDHRGRNNPFLARARTSEISCRTRSVCWRCLKVYSVTRCGSSRKTRINFFKNVPCRSPTLYVCLGKRIW